jgi:hypothetical protein
MGLLAGDGDLCAASTTDPPAGYCLESDAHWLPATRVGQEQAVRTRRLGRLTVPAQGLGCMGMSEFYGTGDQAEAERTIHRALDLGVTHIDTAEVYGPFLSEEIVGEAIKGRRDQVKIATKFGLVSHAGGGPGVVDSSAANVKAAVEGSLKRLGTDHVDLYYQHRVDRNTPIEETPPLSPTSSRKARCSTSASPRRRRRPSAAPTPSSPSPPCRPSTRCGPATWKPRSSRCCANSASASYRTHRSATAC